MLHLPTFSLFQVSPVASAVMHSLAQEIHCFSKDRLKKQCTRVTTVTGKKLLERRTDGGEGDVAQVEELEEENGCGFVQDNSLDLQLGVIRPFLLLGNFFFFWCQFLLNMLTPFQNQTDISVVHCYQLTLAVHRYICICIIVWYAPIFSQNIIQKSLPAECTSQWHRQSVSSSVFQILKHANLF